MKASSRTQGPGKALGAFRDAFILLAILAVLTTVRISVSTDVEPTETPAPGPVAFHEVQAAEPAAEIEPVEPDGAELAEACHAVDQEQPPEADPEPSGGGTPRRDLVIDLDTLVIRIPAGIIDLAGELVRDIASDR